MNGTRLIVAGGTFFVLLCAAFVACGGDDTSGGAPTGQPDGSVNDDSSGGDTGGGGVDAGTFDGHPSPSDPGQVQCGSAGTCDTDTTACCVADDGGFACKGFDANCSGLEIPCDETADCGDDGGVCCGSIDPTSGDLNIDCVSSCGGANSRRLCKSDRDCGNTGPCVTQPCLGAVVSTCGRIPTQYCQQ